MKLTPLLLFYLLPTYLLLISVNSCGNDEFSTDKFIVEKDAIISVENNTEIFNLNDTVFIETTVENQQTATNNENITLNTLFFQDLPETIKLRHNINLYKVSEFGELIAIPINDEFIDIVEGDVITNIGFAPSIQVISTYNGTNFKSKFGIQLKERGTFFLSSERIRDNGLIRITGGSADKGFVEILTSIKNADVDGMYKIVVN